MRDYDAVMPAPFGKLGIQTDADAIVNIDFLSNRSPDVSPNSALAENAIGQLNRYFVDPDWRFTLPLMLAGTPFRRRLWQALQTIPTGSVWTYGRMAQHLGSAPRAVGGACRANPVPIVVPCHRVVSSQGLGGFSGATDGWELDVKRWLLSHEGATV